MLQRSSQAVCGNSAFLLKSWKDFTDELNSDVNVQILGNLTLHSVGAETGLRVRNNRVASQTD